MPRIPIGDNLEISVRYSQDIRVRPYGLSIYRDWTSVGVDMTRAELTAFRDALGIALDDPDSEVCWPTWPGNLAINREYTDAGLIDMTPAEYESLHAAINVILGDGEP